MLTDLRRFSKKYRVKKGEEWYDCDEEDRAWLSVIACRKPPGGHIYTHSETTLGYMSEPNQNHGRLKTKLLTIDGVEIAQEGDFEFAVSFPLELLDTVAKVVKARKRMKLSEAEIQARTAKVLASRNV
jgi:hypothetical protein